MVQQEEKLGRNTAVLDAKLLIVDDERSNVMFLRETLERAGYHAIENTSDPRETLGLCRTFSPDLILLDSVMPNMDGSAVLDQLKVECPSADDTAILMLTEGISRQSKRRALASGAKYFLNKPFDADELLLRTDNVLDERFSQLELQRRYRYLENRLSENEAELNSARQAIDEYALQLDASYTETLERLGQIGELRDCAIGQHTRSVANISVLLAERLGFPTEQLPWLRLAARLHDLGKIAISDVILLKPGKLTVEEFDVMKTHTTIGAELLKGGRCKLIRMAQRIAAGHHERWDGSGYPSGLRGEAIPLEARIVALADVFDALTHERPYKKAWPASEAAAEIEAQSGRHFDPRVVEAFHFLSRSGAFREGDC